MEELEAHFNDLLKLIQDSFIAYNNLSVMVESRKQVKILNEDFFRFLQYQQFFMLNIQLCKILECKRSQQRNVVTLCDNLIKGNYKDKILSYWGSLQPSVNYIDKKYDKFIEKVKAVRKRIKLSNKVIDKLCLARNKVYAHTDINRQIKYLNLVELKELLDLSAFAYNNTRGALHGANADFNHGLNNLNMKGVIRILERGHPVKKRKP